MRCLDVSLDSVFIHLHVKYDVEMMRCTGSRCCLDVGLFTCVCVSTFSNADGFIYVCM